MSDDKLPTREELTRAVEHVKGAIAQAQYLAGEAWVEFVSLDSANEQVDEAVGALVAVARAVLALSSEPASETKAAALAAYQERSHLQWRTSPNWTEPFAAGRSSALARLVAPDEGGGG